MKILVRPELPTASVGSSQAPTAAVDNSAPLAIRTESSTYKLGKAVQTCGATSVRGSVSAWSSRLEIDPAVGHRVRDGDHAHHGEQGYRRVPQAALLQPRTQDTGIAEFKVKACSAQANQMRGPLIEFGLIVRQGIRHVFHRVPELIEDAINELPGRFRRSTSRW